MARELLRQLLGRDGASLSRRAMGAIGLGLAVLTFVSHLAFVDLSQEVLAGDEHWYSYYATYTEAWLLRVCRGALGEASTCGVEEPEHPYLRRIFEETGTGRYLRGEISYDELVSIDGHLPMGDGGRYGWAFAYQVRSPLDTAISVANLTALEMGASLFLTGGFGLYLLVQLLGISLTTVLVALLAARLSNGLGGLLAGGIWVVYSWTQMRGHMGAQPLATTFLVAAFLALHQGLAGSGRAERRGWWILAGLACAGVASFHDVGLRPFVLLPLTLLCLGWLAWRAETRRLVVWPLAWLGLLALATLAAAGLRSQPAEPFSPAFHSANVLVGLQPATSTHKTSFHPRDGWWITNTAPLEEHQKGLRERLLAPHRFLEPVALYRVWSTPWRKYTLKGFEIPLRLHQGLVLLGFAGLLLALGRGPFDPLGGWAWILLAELCAFSLINGFFTVETRRGVPWMAILWPLGAALLARLAVARGLSWLVGAVIAAVTFAAVWDVGALALPFGLWPALTPPSWMLFGLVLAGRVALAVAVMLWAARCLEGSSRESAGNDRTWRLWAMGPLVVFVVLFAWGQIHSHWREWSVVLEPGMAVRQRIVLPDELPWTGDDSPWLVLDAARGAEHLAVRINGREIKAAGEPMTIWQREDKRYARAWRGVALSSKRLPAELLRPGQELVVEVEAVGREVRLYGNVPSSDPEIWYGPAIDWQGAYRSLWRAQWSPVGDPRVPWTQALHGLRYASELERGGVTRTRDLSTSLGRQHGLYRVFLGGFDPADAPQMP